ncbi:ribosomal protein L7/L12 [Streptomyces griseoloalbus]|uniref:Ribosomal protein L7/L12 n=1 Tax=Streptomyces griseoloalbus TaxID=67303 RepID=A0ABV3DYJ3_9ACTN
MDTAVLFLTCVVILGIATLQTRLSRAERRAARAERKLDLVLGHLGLRDEVPRLDEIVALVHQGKKIQAIKVYREATGADLVEAKEAVDRLG